MSTNPQYEKQAVEKRLSTKLTDAEEDRLEALLSRGPFHVKPIDHKLLDLGWIGWWDGRSDQVDSLPGRSAEYAGYKARTRRAAGGPERDCQCDACRVIRGEVMSNG